MGLLVPVWGPISLFSGSGTSEPKTASERARSAGWTIIIIGVGVLIVAVAVMMIVKAGKGVVHK